MEEWKVPTTDEEAIHMLGKECDDTISRSLIGIYRCRRATGATILEAIEVALKACVDTYDRKRAQQT